MIATLRGLLTRKLPSAIVIEVSGVGYEVHVPVGSLSELPPEGNEVFLYIYTHVREDALQLFGFTALGEKNIFTTLLGITGIGPKLALGILSGISYEDFHIAVESEDIATLTKVPGLGKKTANRIVLELRGKLPSEELSSVTGKGPSVASDAVSALVNLGYKKSDAQSAVDISIKAGHDNIEDLLKDVLGNFKGEGT